MPIWITLVVLAAFLALAAAVAIASLRGTPRRTAARPGPRESGTDAEQDGTPGRDQQDS